MTMMSPISTNETVCVSVSVCLCADLLVVKNPGGSLALELLLLQDALKVLHALLWVFHMSRQVAVEEADGMAEHWHAGADTTFIPLWATASREEVKKYFRKVRKTLVKERECLYFLQKQNHINDWISDVKLLYTVTGASVFSLYWVVCVCVTEKQEVYQGRMPSILNANSKVHSGGTGWVCGLLPAVPPDCCDPLKHKRCLSMKSAESAEFKQRGFSL